jgi:PKHD-type hydroxylase
MSYATRLVNNVKQKMLVPKNYCIDTGFFTTSDVDAINAYCSNFMLKDGELFNGADHSERKAKLHFIDWPCGINWVFDKMNTLVGYYNDTEFGFDLVGYEYMQYAEYHTGGHQRYHTDVRYNFDPAYVMEGFRKLTVILMLSDPSEYEGGELSLNLSAEFRAEKLKLQKGQVLLFPSYMPHQVEPVISGVRKTLVVWPLGPKFK